MPVEVAHLTSSGAVAHLNLFFFFHHPWPADPLHRGMSQYQSITMVGCQVHSSSMLRWPWPSEQDAVSSWDALAAHDRVACTAPCSSSIEP